MLTTLLTAQALSAQLRLWEIVARLACAMLVGLLIGGEREITHRPAGMRTHMLVSLGACTVMITSQLIYAQYHAFGANPDPARLSAQVITGVGFLGAGTILREGASIKGLTTAAGRSNVVLSELESHRLEDDMYRFSFRADFKGLHIAASRSTFFSQLAATHCICSVNEVTEDK